MSLKQIDDTLVDRWSRGVPRFYGLPVVPGLLDDLLAVQESLVAGSSTSLPMTLCRAIACHHSAGGPKVPLSLNTVMGCVRGRFVELNQNLRPNSPTCYDGHCYLYHARTVPAKSASHSRVIAHRFSPEVLREAGRIAQAFGISVRDNQSSDGSVSMSLRLPNDGPALLPEYLREITFAGSVSYIVFSTAYARVPDQTLSELAQFSGLAVHVTVSGWHSREENSHRIAEFERYAARGVRTWLRVVNREDWRTPNGNAAGTAAACEEWLFREIARLRLETSTIRVPFHSVNKFPGSNRGTLGTRHMAGATYAPYLLDAHAAGMAECCTTGKCKTCPTACGATRPRTNRDVSMAALAHRALFIAQSSSRFGGVCDPHAAYVARLLARKAHLEFAEAGNVGEANEMQDAARELDGKIAAMSLSSVARKRLTDDAHALVIEGIDRHSLWTDRSGIGVGPT